MTNDMPEIELDLPSSDDAMPKWLATVITAIAAIVPIPADLAFETLKAIVAPLAKDARWLALPVHVQAVARAAKDAKLAEINAARKAPATERQSMLVVEPVAESAQEPVRAPTVPSEPPLLQGKFKRITSRGNVWGAAIELANGSGVPTSGQRVYVARSDGGGGARKRIGEIVWSGASNTTRNATAYFVTLVDDTATGTTPARGVPTIDTTPQPIPAFAQAAIEQDRAADRAATVEGSLANVASEARTNAAVPAQTRSIAPGVAPSRIVERRSEVRGLLAERDFVAGAVAEGAMLQVSWTGGGETTCGKVDDALRLIGREQDAPERKSALAYCGDAVDAMRSREYDTARLPSKALPEGIQARWIVGRKLTGREINAGDAYGETLLVVSLKDDDTLDMDGSIDLANSVRARYAALTAMLVLKSDTLTVWLGRTLRTRHAAVKRGHLWYVPGGQADAVRALIGAISPLWGDHETIPVTTGADLMRSLTRGLADEVRAVDVKLVKERETARERAGVKARKEAMQLHNATPEAVEAAGKLAEQRATVSAEIAAKRLAELATIAAKVAGYEMVLGSEATAGIKGSIGALVAELQPLTDNTSARAQMLELYDDTNAQQARDERDGISR